MSNKLSHSAIGRFKMCAENYRLHYVERIRPIGTSSPLIFGAALDQALNTLLTSETPAEEVFEREFEHQDVNGERTYLPTCADVTYQKNDIDTDLLTEADAKRLKDESEKRGIECSDYLSTVKRLRKQDTLSKSERELYNLANWLCLFRKGMLMITAYRKDVLPHISKVHAIQESFELDNGCDKVVGFIDLIADVTGEGTVILDNKTTSRPYERDSVIKSEQLSLYVHAMEEKYRTRKAGYIALNKNVVKNKVKICSVCGFDGSETSHGTCNNEIDGKRCHSRYNVTMSPEIKVQIIIDEIPEEMEASVINGADIVNDRITANDFGMCSIEQCSNWFGKPCCYYNLCHGSGSLDGLIKLEKKDGGK